ncbi:MAG: HAMP domain-containing histidine kinase [Deltaproteobacteria bacterium]|nr:HAMP domain-containing histidine kinase [Deltaproteobacteria bacterium]
MSRRGASRSRWLVGALIGGLGSLAAGIAWLASIAIEERDEAHAQLQRHREALERAASAELGRELERALDGANADIEAALRDPFSSSVDLLLVVEGRPVLPRRARPAAPPPQPASAPDADVEARAALARAVAEGPAAYDAWLDHRVHHRLALSVELASTLDAIERLDRAGALDPERARALLRDGLARPDGRVEGWLHTLLSQLDRVPAPDLDAALARALDVARRHLVRVDDVLARVAEQRSPIDPPTTLATAGSPALTCDARACWAYRTTPDGAIRGRRFDPRARLDALARAWTTSGQVPSDVVMRLASTSPDARVVMASATWDADGARADARLATKIIALAVVAALGVAVVALAILLQRRRTAYLDLRSHLLRAVTHELKTPIASISALAQTLELRLEQVPEARDYPARIVATADRLAFLVDNVLSFARLEQEAWTPRLQSIGVRELGAWLAGEPVARAVRPIDLEVDAPPGLALTGDPELVRLLVSNLVDNAAKYASADRVHVRLAARADAAGVHLVVADDGPGLGVPDPDRLFDDFARGRVEGVRGTGLGLSICRWVMALHRGTIRVAATGPTGTTFEATFPPPPRTAT